MLSIEEKQAVQMFMSKREARNIYHAVQVALDADQGRAITHDGMRGELIEFLAKMQSSGVV